MINRTLNLCDLNLYDKYKHVNDSKDDKYDDTDDDDDGDCYCPGEIFSIALFNSLNSHSVV